MYTVQVTCPCSLTVAPSDVLVHPLSSFCWRLGTRRRYYLFFRTQTTDRSPPRNATVRAHDVQPVKGPGQCRNAHMNRRTTLINLPFRARLNPYLPSGFLMIKSSLMTPHVWPAHQGSDNRPFRHSPPKFRFPNRRRAKLSFVDQSQFAMSSSICLLGQSCITYRFAWRISSTPPHCLSQIPQPLS